MNLTIYVQASIFYMDSMNRWHYCMCVSKYAICCLLFVCYWENVYINVAFVCVDIIYRCIGVHVYMSLYHYFKYAVPLESGCSGEFSDQEPPLLKVTKRCHKQGATSSDEDDTLLMELAKRMCEKR